MITQSALLAVMLVLGCGGCSTPSSANLGDDPALFDESFSKASLDAQWREVQAIMDRQERDERQANAADECRCAMQVSP